MGDRAFAVLVGLSLLLAGCNKAKAKYEQAQQAEKDGHATDALKLYGEACKADPKSDQGVQACKRAEELQSSMDSAVVSGGGMPTLPTISVDPSQIDRLVITAKTKPEVTLVNRSGTWIVVAPPPEGLANAKRVSDLLANLKDMKVTGQYVAHPQDGDLATYELTADKAIHVVAFHGAVSVVDISIGKSGGRGDAVRLQGSGAVLCASGVSSWLYDRSPDDWRSK